RGAAAGGLGRARRRRHARRDVVDRVAALTADVDLPVHAFAERGRVEAGDRHAEAVGIPGHAVVGRGQAVGVARSVVGEEVRADDRGRGTAARDEAAGDRTAAAAVIVGVHGEREHARGGTGRHAHATARVTGQAVALVAIPAVVLAAAAGGGLEIDFFDL